MERKEIYRKVCDSNLQDEVQKIQALTEEIVGMMEQLPHRKMYCSFNRHVDEFYTNTKQVNEALKTYVEAIDSYLTDYQRSRKVHREMRAAVERMRSHKEPESPESPET